MMDESAKLTAGGGIFIKLKALGVDFVFCNSGTDFPPIIEGLAEAAEKGIDLPQALVIPHEHAAMGMAHGYYLLSGKAQAVMLHTNVGLSNGATATINAACDHVPILLMSGRTPVTEHTRFGARTVPIGWGQEMRDQTAFVRESCKWDYELRFPEQIAEVLDRAYAIANSTPKGPVYLSLPRETLCESVDRHALDKPTAMLPVQAAADPESLRRAAQLLSSAKAPLIIAQRGSGDERSFQAFAEFVESWAIPVCSYWAVQLALDTSHDCAIGADPLPWIEDADVIVVLDSLAPWWPDQHHPNADATIIQIGPDPLFSRTPVRNFRSDIGLLGESSQVLPALIEQMELCSRDESAIDCRREAIKESSIRIRQKSFAEATAGEKSPMTKEWVGHCLGKALAGYRSSVFSELGVPLTATGRSEHSSWFQEPHSGGLGWCLPAAMGAQLADPDRLIVATMGDGSYLFSNPAVCHQIAEALKLPIITLILNNNEWGAVRQSVAAVYPDGYAARANQVPLTSLAPSPDFTRTASASRAWVSVVEDGSELPAVLAEAIKVAVEEKRQVLLDIQIC